MKDIIKQFVPSATCLACDGCCRFDLADSHWRPKVGQAEPLADAADGRGYLITRPLGARHQCEYFNPLDFTCSVYDKRPFECALYPFVLSKEDDAIKCYVHLACPYVGEQIGTDRYQRYAAYLRDWFASKSVHLWLNENNRLLHDYRHALIELEYLFTL